MRAVAPPQGATRFRRGTSRRYCPAHDAAGRHAPCRDRGPHMAQFDAAFGQRLHPHQIHVRDVRRHCVRHAGCARAQFSRDRLRRRQPWGSETRDRRRNRAMFVDLEFRDPRMRNPTRGLPVLENSAGPTPCRLGRGREFNPHRQHHLFCAKCSARAGDSAFSGAPGSSSGRHQRHSCSELTPNRSRKDRPDRRPHQAVVLARNDGGAGNGPSPSLDGASIPPIAQS